MGVEVRVEWRGPELVNLVRQAAITGLNQAIEQLLSYALERVPVDTGDLRRSGSVHPAIPDDMTAWVVFNMFYAVWVHEGVGMRIRTVRNPRAQSKFLEAPAIEYHNVLAQIVLAAVRRAIQ